MKKRLVALVMTLCTLLSLNVSVLAAASNANVALETSDAELAVLTTVFESDNQVQLIDIDGNNVRSEFVNKNMAAYKAGMFEGIIEQIADESLTLIEPNGLVKEPIKESKSDVFTRGLVYDTATGTKIIKLKNPSGQVTTGRYTVTLQARFAINDYNNTISGAVSGMQIIKQSVNPQTMAAGGERITNESSSITNNSKKISFSGLLHVRSYTTTPGIGGYLQTEWATISKSI